ncbi:unnamed protein product [Thelazia callipaeda]|uniref:Sugar transporter SWEET n=1 Tax=Thelazia callipaeda TaxID=103827 RepID=A0A0N5D706_THECL|nr:unnamed protein product [Thelazia callipaeda]
MSAIRAVETTHHFLDWLSFFAIVTTVCLFLTGLEICWRIKSKRTTDGVSSAPFHMGFVSGQLWLQYGLLRENKTIITVNSVASLLYSCYLLFYFIMAPSATKKRCIKLIFLEVLFLISVHYYVYYYGLPVEDARSHLGLCCMVFNVFSVASPLEALREVFRTRCTETMPLPLCCFTFLVTMEWLLYGVLIDDFYIKVDQFVNLGVSVAQRYRITDCICTAHTFFLLSKKAIRAAMMSNM